MFLAVFTGESYANGDWSDVEVWEHIEDAQDSLDSRYTTGHWLPQPIAFTDGRISRDLWPAVTDHDALSIYHAPDELTEHAVRDATQSGHEPITTLYPKKEA